MPPTTPSSDSSHSSDSSGPSDSSDAPESLQSPASLQSPESRRTPREVLTRFYQAMRDKSADDLADLYAVDAVHEFPFSSPGFPPRYEGREEVRTAYRAAWGAAVIQVTDITGVTVYETDAPGTIVAEHVVVGTAPGTDAEFTVPGLLILRVRDGLLTHVRDYMDGLSVARTRN